MIYLLIAKPVLVCPVYDFAFVAARFRHHSHFRPASGSTIRSTRANRQLPYRSGRHDLLGEQQIRLRIDGDSAVWRRALILRVEYNDIKQFPSEMVNYPAIRFLPKIMDLLMSRWPLVGGWLPYRGG